MGHAIKSRLLSSIPFWVCSGVTIILFVLGFVCPPAGQIDASILKAGAELFAYATLAVVADAIRFGYDATVTHGNTVITINNNEDEKKNAKAKIEEK